LEPSGEYRLRLARNEDIGALRALIEVSVRGLQSGDYTAAQLDGALGTALGVDAQLIEDGTYYVAETREGKLIACGGWSKRKTLFGSDQLANREDAFLNPATDAAKIRAFFVDPGWTRRGIATQILETCERAAKETGFRRYEMGATLTGVPMYAARGYAKGERMEVALPNGERYTVIRMTKSAE